MLQWVFSHPLFRAIVIYTAIAWLGFWADPLGIAEQKHRALDSDFAVVTQYLRIGPPKDLAVLLIDQNALKEGSLELPIPDSKVADLFHEPACARAQGVFLDFPAPRQYNPADTDKPLRDAVENSS